MEMPTHTAFQAGDWRSDCGQPTCCPSVDRRARPRTRDDDGFTRARALIEDAKALLATQFTMIAGGERPDIKRLAASADEIARSIERHPYALLSLSRLRGRHEYTFAHSVGVSALMIAVAKQLKLPVAEIRSLGIAGLLHDVGKSRIKLAILDKPGPLSDAEWQAIKIHPARGWTILERVGVTDPIVLNVTRHHHERIDGTGYPDAIAGDQLSIHVRIAGVCDVFDALCAKRAYKDQLSPCDALDLMLETVGHFDPAILRTLRNILPPFPAGTLVRLESGRLGIVTDEIANNPVRPNVRLIYNVWLRQPLDGAICSTGDDPIICIEKRSAWKI